jgi:FkbM family methyltransferase
MLDRAWGIGRSLIMYHGQPGKHRRMVRFYREFLEPGDVGFDLGAHVGSRVRAWRQLGVRVIAVEPQPDCQRILRLFFGRDDDVLIVAGAVGARAGRARLGISTATPTVSSMSPDWTESVAADRSFARVRWDRSIEVDVSTLDDLIAVHGLPAFCKIDVEGFEVDVLTGLTHPLRALSFEYLPPAHDAALTALGLVEQLGAAVGGYRYNYSPIETLRFASDRWLDAAELVHLLERFRPLGRSGDVYARLARPEGPAMSKSESEQAPRGDDVVGGGARRDPPAELPGQGRP